MMTICFQVMSNGGSIRRVCQMNQNCTVKDLFQQASDTVSGLIDSLKFGYPPQTLRLSDSNKDLLIKDVGVTNQEKIFISVSSESSVTTSKVSKSDTEVSNHSKTGKKKASTINEITTEVKPEYNGRPRRKAAEIANDSFLHASKLMEENDKASKKQKKSSPKPMTPEIKEKLATARHFKTLESASTARRLYDGAIVGQAKVTRSRSSFGGGATNVEEGLMNSFGSSSKGARLLRQGWKQAVNSMYEQNQSVARLASIGANTVQFEIVNTSTSSAPSLQVKYPKGVQGRSDKFYEDIVSELIDVDALKEVTRMLCNSDATTEALRPSNLALLSPRVFWSLHYHYRINKGTEENISSEKDPTVACLQWIQPSINWSYLRRRATKLSTKAQENLRQKQEKANNESTSNWEAAVSAIESVEQAMANMYDNHSSVALGNLTERSDQFEWKLETPEELDADELIECISKSSLHDKFKSDDVTIFASLLSEKCNVRNWRELANSQADDIHAMLMKIDYSKAELTVDDVDSWIDYAQERSLDEIIYEICDNDDDAIELLQQAANSGTPKDLAGWLSIVPQLHQELQGCVKRSLKSRSVPSQDQLKTWCQKSEIVLNQLDWLNCYLTPIG